MSRGGLLASCDIGFAYLHTSTFIHTWHRTDWPPAAGKATVAA